jgi:elongation factor Ts
MLLSGKTSKVIHKSMVSADKIKSLREKTGLSVMLLKKALEQSGGEEKAAIEWLRQQGIETARSRSQRSTGAGIVEAYLHNNGQIGVLVELRSETDFVSRNPLFKEAAHNLAMQVAASNPADIKALLEESYIKNLDITVRDYLTGLIQKFGENIEIARFERFEI